MMVNGHRKIVKDRTAHGLKVRWKIIEIRLSYFLMPDASRKKAFLPEEIDYCLEGLLPLHCVGSPTVVACINHLAPVPQASTLPPSRKSTPVTWCRGGPPRRPCLSSGNEPFARGQWDYTLKAPPYHAPGYLLLRSGPDGTSTFRCPRPSVSLPSEQYLWARGSAPKKGVIRY